MADIMKRYIYVLILVSLHIFVFAPVDLSAAAAGRYPTAVKGYINLSGVDFAKTDAVNLDGEWEFYWNKLLLPSDFSSLSKPVPDAYLSVPGYWNLDPAAESKFPATGAATYRLTIDISDQNMLYGFIIPKTNTSYRLWINGKMVASAGNVSLKPEEMTPQFLRQTVYVRPDSGRMEIVWQVANSNYRKSGIWLSLKMGQAHSITYINDRNIGIDIFIAGCLLMMALYHVGLYFYRKKDRAPLYFGLFCFVNVIRILTTGEFLLESVFPGFSWEIARKLEYSPFYIGGPLFLLFLYSVFPKDIKKSVVAVFAVLSGIMGIAVIITPARINNYLVNPLQLVALFGLVYLMVCIFVAVLKKRPGAMYIFFGFMMVILAFINDVLFVNGVISTFFMVPFSLLLLIFSQSLMLAMRFSDSFMRIEVLSQNLTDINVSMKRFVPYEFLNFLGKESIIDVMIGDQTQQEMTVFFCDIRSFTSTTEKMTPQEAINFLNSYLSLVIPVIRAHKGFIDKFIGDEVMALFPDCTGSAVDSAIEVQKRLHIYNAENEGNSGFPIRLVIGLHAGKLMLGTIGDLNRLDTTVISDTVNVSSRIENLTKIYGAEIIISEEVLRKLSNREKYFVRNVDCVKVKGKSEAVTIYEVLDCLSDKGKEKKLQTKEEFERAVNLYHAGDMTAAAKIFTELQSVDPDDIAITLYLSRCNDRRKNIQSCLINGVEVFD